MSDLLIKRLHEAAVELGNNGVPVKPLSGLLMEAAAALAAAAPPPDRNDLLAVGRAQSQHDAGGSRSSPATVPSITKEG